MTESQDQISESARPEPPDSAPESPNAPPQATPGTPLPEPARAADLHDPPPAGQPQLVPALPPARSRHSVTGYLAAGLALAAVACLVTWNAFANGVGGVNIVLFLVVTAVAIAELTARAVARLRTRSAPPGPPAPAGPGTESIPNAARVLSVLGILGVGAIMGFLSLLGGMAGDGCSTKGCNTAIGAAWGVLLATQILICLTALIGAAGSKRPGQVARAAILGIVAPVLAFIAFGAAADSVTGSMQYAATAHCGQIWRTPT